MISNHSLLSKTSVITLLVITVGLFGMQSSDMFALAQVENGTSIIDDTIYADYPRGVTYENLELVNTLDHETLGLSIDYPDFYEPIIDDDLITFPGWPTITIEKFNGTASDVVNDLKLDCIYTEKFIEDNYCWDVIISFQELTIDGESVNIY